jgi:hypothetical protein
VLALNYTSSQENDVCVGDFVILRGGLETNKDILSTPYYLAKVIFRMLSYAIYIVYNNTLFHR